jgi:uncharacterized Fe-S cluster-containing radical SAM superfamily protein
MPRSPNLLAFDRRNPRLAELPDDIMIEPIMGCNLRCPMCPVTELPGSMDGRGRKLMTMEVYTRIVDELSDKPRMIQLTVMGEPLLHPQIVEFIALGKRRRHRMSLITNGTRLSLEMSRRLLDAGLDVLVLSMDGFEKATFEGLRVGASYDAIVANLRGLSRLNAERGSPLRIEINYVVSSRTAGEREAFAREYGPLVSAINFNPIADLGGQFPIPLDLVVRGGDPRLDATQMPAWPRSPCLYLWSSMFISAEGRVMLCCNDFKLSSGLSTVEERPLLEIWRHEVGRLRQQHLANRFEAEPCASCSLNRVPAQITAADRLRFTRRERAHRLASALVPARMLPAAVAEPVGALDVPAPDTFLSGYAPVQGWAFARLGRTIEKLEVRIDGVALGAAEWGHLRPDVAAIHPGDGRTFSGFRYELDTRAVADGPHTIEISATDSRGRSVDFGRRSVTVANTDRNTAS